MRKKFNHPHVDSSKAKNAPKIIDFGGKWGTLALTIGYPIASILILLSEEPSPISKNLFSVSTYVHLPSILAYDTYLVFIALLSIIPLPPLWKSNDLTRGNFCVMVCLVVFGILEVGKIPVGEFIFDHHLHLLVAAVISGYFLITFAYVRSFFVPKANLNSYAIGNGAIYGYFMGRELRPRVLCGLLDFKMYVNRLTSVTGILLDTAFLYRCVTHSYLTPTILVLLIFRMVYWLDALIAEAAYTSSFEVQQEGFGFSAGMGYLVYPLRTLSLSKFVYSNRIEFGVWRLLILSTICLIGIVLFRGANNQKHRFRQNPDSVSDPDKISTHVKGKPLLCAGYWGFVRHPNYLGDVCVQLACTGFLISTVSVLVNYECVILLLLRCGRDGARCKEKYGNAWKKYCERVKYALIPGLY